MYFYISFFPHMFTVENRALGCLCVVNGIKGWKTHGHGFHQRLADIWKFNLFQVFLVCFRSIECLCVCGHWWLKNHGHGFQQRVDQQPPGILPVLPMLTAAPGPHAGFWLSLSDHCQLSMWTTRVVVPVLTGATLVPMQAFGFPFPVHCFPVSVNHSFQSCPY